MHGKSGAKGGGRKIKSVLLEKKWEKSGGGTLHLSICNVFFSDNR
jgi:hypothetical protein